jgi:hypothetical protein
MAVGSSDHPAPGRACRAKGRLILVNGHHHRWFHKSVPGGWGQAERPTARRSLRNRAQRQVVRIAFFARAISEDQSLADAFPAKHHKVPYAAIHGALEVTERTTFMGSARADRAICSCRRRTLSRMRELPCLPHRGWRPNHNEGKLAPRVTMTISGNTPISQTTVGSQGRWHAIMPRRIRRSLASGSRAIHASKRSGSSRSRASHPPPWSCCRCGLGRRRTCLFRQRCSWSVLRSGRPSKAASSIFRPDGKTSSVWTMADPREWADAFCCSGVGGPRRGTGGVRGGCRFNLHDCSNTATSVNASVAVAR